MEGKVFKARIRYTCKKMAGGGCAVSTFCILSFKKDTVDVWERAVASCTPESLEAAYSYSGEDDKKRYPWKLEGKIIKIEGFPAYGVLTIENTRLLAGNVLNDENEPLVFEEEYE